MKPMLFHIERIEDFTYEVTKFYQLVYAIDEESARKLLREKYPDFTSIDNATIFDHED